MTPDPRVFGVLFCLPSLAMIGRSSLPLFSLGLAALAWTHPRSRRALALGIALIALHTLLVRPTDMVLYAGRVLTLVVALGACLWLVAHPAAARLLGSRAFHATVFAVMMPMALAEAVFKLTGFEPLGALIEAVRWVLVSQEDAPNFRNGNVLLFFQEQSFVPYFALYAAAVWRFLGMRRYLALIALLAAFHESGTFVLMLPFIAGLLLPRLPLVLLPVLLTLSVVVVVNDEFLGSRALRLLAGEDIDDSTFSRIIPFLAGVSALGSQPLGVGVSNYGAVVTQLLEPYLSGPLGATLTNSLEQGWLGYKLFDDGRLSYTSQLFGLYIEFGWIAVVGSLVVVARLLRRLRHHDDLYHRVVALAGCVVAFAFSMPIMFPFVYAALALALRARRAPRVAPGIARPKPRPAAGGDAARTQPA